MITIEGKTDFKGAMTADIAEKIYRALLRCRKFDEKIVELYPEQEMKCPAHLSIGQEAVASGVCGALNKEDMVFSTHRCHSHTMAKGCDMNIMMAELYGKETGCCRGKGGSMHFVEPEMGMMGSSAIVGGTMPIAVGAALASKMQGKKIVTVAFFGDGMLEQGTFHEGLNFASIHKLPIIFVCENNDMATCTHLLPDRQPYMELYRRAEGYNIPGVRVDGTRADQTYFAALKAVERARKGEGPTFIEGVCYRWKEHVGFKTDFHMGHRTEAELNEWMKLDPVTLFAEYAEKNKLLARDAAQKISDDIQKQVNDSVTFAKQSPFPKPESIYEDL